MHPPPTVSVIVIFLDEARFLDEAIRSVFTQTFRRWELLLVDDGSTDGSSRIASSWAADHPDRVRHLAHENHANRGMSASRNLGLRHARGEFVAFLDADDVWLPHKLEQQLVLLTRSEAAMVYGPGLYWHSWTREEADEGRDFIQELGIPSCTLSRPPALVPMYLRHPERTPSPSGVIVRRELLVRLGGCEESFRGLYEDQVLCTKIALAAPVQVSGECWYRYRQHPASCCARASESGSTVAARLMFLDWLSQYLAVAQVASPDVKRALDHEMARLRGTAGLRSVRGLIRPLVPSGLHRLIRSRQSIWRRR